MRKIILICLSIFLVFSCAKKDKENNVQTSKEKAEIKFIFPDGLPALSILELYSNEEQFDEKIILSYEKIKTIDVLTAALISKDEIVAIVPSNLAAQLYNKDLDYQILGTVSWGSLYLVSSEEVNNLLDIKNKKVGVIGRGQTPDIVFRNILAENNIDPDSVDLEYFNSGTELANALGAKTIGTAVISEPNVSMLTAKNKDIKIILSLNDEWKRIHSTESGFPQATLIAKKDLVEKYPEFINSLLTEMKKQNEWLKNGESKEENLKKTEIPVPDKLLPEIIKNSNINFIPISESSEEYKKYYQILSEFDPKTIGGKIPDEKIFGRE